MKSTVKPTTRSTPKSTTKSTLASCFLFISLLGAGALPCQAQTGAAGKPSAGQEQKASQWVAALQLNNTSKEAAVRELIAGHMQAVRDWHNSHSYTMVPAGMNPETGQPLSKLDRQMIIDSSMPDSVHTDFMKGLRASLNEAQVDQILDDITIGKVDFTMKGYHAIVPDLTAKEQTALRGFLEQAREQAIDYKNMKEISAIFEIYKTKCEQYLNANGRNWHALYKAYYNKMKAEKEAKKKQQA
jgi:hypothetical protein